MTDTHIRRKRKKRGDWLRRALRVVAPVALVVSLAAPAFAAQIVQVRVGNHPTFSRVVFELDTHAGYQIESRGATDSKVLAVLIDADSRNRDVISKSLGIGSVTVEAVGGKSLVLVTLRRDDLVIKEMILSNPPRIVLDFRYPDPAPAAKIASTSSGSAPIDDAPVPVTAEPVSIEPETLESVHVEPEPIRSEPVAVAPVVASPAVSEPDPELEPEPEIVVVAEPEPRDEAIDDSRLGNEFAAGANGATPSPDPTVGDSMIDTPQTQAFTVEHDTVAQTATEKMPAPMAVRTQASVPVEKPPAIAQSPIPHSRDPQQPKSNMALIAAVGAGVLLVAGVVLVMKRRASLPNDLDLAALPNEFANYDEPAPVTRIESEPTEIIRIPRDGFEVPDVTALTDDAKADVGYAAARVSEANTAAYSLSEVSANSARAGTELFDEDPEGEKQMDMEANDLLAQRGVFAASPAVSSRGDSADSELASMVQELMTRLGTLETRLEESNEARERLESQVAAQSEELRVQRAAIARTQRALRSLSRTDEDQATEPALRNPSA